MSQKLGCAGASSASSLCRSGTPIFVEKYPFPRRDGLTEWEGRGVGKWRDADPDNFREVLAIVDRLKISAV